MSFAKGVTNSKNCDFVICACATCTGGATCDKTVAEANNTNPALTFIIIFLVDSIFFLSLRRASCVWRNFFIRNAPI